MMRRTLTSMSLLLLVAVPLSAQTKEKDPTHKVAGGALPAGWSGRTDKAADKLEDAKFVTMGSGYHVTSGPAAIYWNDKDKVKGPFTASATFRQTKKPEHPEAYGLIFAGNKLDTPEQTYYYVLVRGDGKVLVNHRAGAAVHKIVEWKEQEVGGSHQLDCTCVRDVPVRDHRRELVSVVVAPDASQVNFEHICEVGPPGEHLGGRVEEEHVGTRQGIEPSRRSSQSAPGRAGSPIRPPIARVCVP